MPYEFTLPDAYTVFCDTRDCSSHVSFRAKSIGHKAAELKDRGWKAIVDPNDETRLLYSCIVCTDRINADVAKIYP